MAEAVLLSALLPVVFEKTASLIEQHLGKIRGANVKGELQRLQGTLSTIRGVLQDAEEKQVRDEALKQWLSKLKDAAYTADDLLEDFNLHLMRRRRMEAEFRSGPMIKSSKVRDFFSSSHNPILFHARMEGRLKEINGRIDEIAAERSKFNLRTNDYSLNVLPANYSRPPTHSYVPESDVIGREADVERIVELLIGQENEKNAAVLPIVGMGGLGKTTLLQMVYNDQRLKDHFELRMWVSVPDDFSVEKIVKIMIGTASGSRSELDDMDSLQRNLREVIGGKRYMLALDDVWNEDPLKWEALKVLLTFGAHGSAVVVTTRSGIVSSIIGTLDPYRLAGLSDDDSWILFKQRAFPRGAVERPSLVEMGRLIVNKCGGLPLAAKVLGSLMRLKFEEREWRSVMESNIWGLPAGRNDILPALRLSYHHLPPHLKQCFAFCAIFPRGYEIEKEMLIELWLANGFIPSEVRIMEYEFGGDAIFNELKQRCFFQDIEEDRGLQYGRSLRTTCRMHDLIHDLAISIMGHECCVLDKWEDISNSNFRHLFINYRGGNRGMDAASSSLNAAIRTVRTLIFNNRRHPIGDLPQRFVWPNTKYLRVLSLHHIGMLEFPLSICNLRHLRYLDLSDNGIQTLPEAISRLLNLQTLNLSVCMSLLWLPKSMRYLSGLMHLYLDGCDELTCMPSGIGQLRRLRTLTMYTVGSEGAGSGKIGDLKGLNLHGMLQLRNLKNVENPADAEQANIGSKENLHLLELDWGKKDAVEFGTGIAEEVLQALQPHQNLKELRIFDYKGTKLPTWLMGESIILANMVEIVLNDCSRCEHLPQLWRLPSLEFLEIRGMESVKHIGGCEFYGTTSVVQDDTTIFPSLRKLELSNMRNLEEWSGVEGRGAFPSIVEIDIMNCPKLQTMPALPSTRLLRIRDCPLLRPADGFFGCMKSLERLVIDSCDKLIMMVEQEDGPIDSIRYLEIKGCQQLMFSSPLSKYFNCLQNLEILDCELPFTVFQGLSSLRRLVIESLSSSPSSSEGLQFQGFPVLEDLSVYLHESIHCFHPEGLLHLTTLKSLFLSGDHHGVVAALPEFPVLVRDVNIVNCPSLISLPEGLGRLTALERFTIIDLPMLTSLPEEEMQGYKSLKYLRIVICRGLVSLPVGLQQRLPSLESLTIIGCPDLERCCIPGGEYWHLVQSIPIRHIGY